MSPNGAGDVPAGTPSPHVPAGTPYHRLAHLREPWARPGRPVLTVLLAIIAYLVLASILLVVVVTSLALLPGADAELGMRLGDPASPLDVGMSLAMGALWWPAALIGVRFGGWRPVRWLLSVRGAVRWELVRAAALPVAAASLLGTVVVTLLVAWTDPGTGVGPVEPGPALLATVLAAVLGVVKAIGVELAMRGLLLQAIGTWLRSPLLTIVLAALLTLPAATLTGPGLLLALLLGISCGCLAWRSGGLELPILLTASLTVSGGVVASLVRIGEGRIRALFSDAELGAGTATAELGRTAAAAGIPGVGTATVVGALGIGVLALLIAAALGRWIGRRERLGATEPVRRPADAPAPDLVAV